MLASILSALSLSSSEPEPIPGPEQIALARQELTEDEHPDQAMIGEAYLENYGGEFSNDLKAVIPLHISKYDDPAPLTFDVDGDQLEQFCTAFGVNVREIGVLYGATLPIRWEQGSPVPDWQTLLDDPEGQ